MSSEIIINTNPYETIVALLDNGTVTELFIERKQEKGIAGNIYKGKVIKVLPGMQTAFVDIGLDRAGFLYVSDIDTLDIMDEHEKILLKEETNIEEIVNCKESLSSFGLKPLPIEDVLEEGQEILVQVSKDPLGIKGARITSYISLPGRYLVFMPTIDHIGISRRIEDEKERKRLKKIIAQIKQPGSGYILRTVSEGKKPDEFNKDANFLNKLWEHLKQKTAKTHAPALVYRDLDLVLRTVRDLFTENVTKLIVDSPEEYERIKKFIRRYLPAFLSRLKLYEGKESIFEAYDIEFEIARALGRKVWLKSGGYIVIDQTEALVAIDINTGKFVGKRNHDETILKTNLEAVKEIVYQLRLRNIGGLIIIDFIDMKRQQDREKVFHALEQSLKSDRSRTTVLRFSELGIVEMTRKRVRENLEKILCKPCPYCEGRGSIKSPTTICYEIFRKFQKKQQNFLNKKQITINVHPEIADLLFDEESDYIANLENKLKKKIYIKPNSTLHHEQYKIY